MVSDISTEVRRGFLKGKCGDNSIMPRPLPTGSFKDQ